MSEQAHKPHCEIRRGHSIVYPVPIQPPSMVKLAEIAAGRLARGYENDPIMQGTTSRPTRCTCHLPPSYGQQDESEQEMTKTLLRAWTA